MLECNLNQALWTRKLYPAIADLQAITQPIYLRETDTNADAGTNTLNLTVVSSGYLWIITSVCAFNITSAITRITMDVVHDGTTYNEKRKLSPAIQEALEYNGFMVLDASDYVSINFVGCVAGDSIYANASGYEVAVDSY